MKLPHLGSKDPALETINLHHSSDSMMGTSMRDLTQ